MLKKRKGKSPWISRDTLKLKRRLKRLKTKRGTARDLDALLTKISELSSELKMKVSSDKQRYFGEKLPEFISTSPEKFWRMISPTKQINDAFVVNGVLSDDSAVIADAFNLHFRSVFTHDNGSLPYCHASYPLCLLTLLLMRMEHLTCSLTLILKNHLVLMVCQMNF